MLFIICAFSNSPNSGESQRDEEAASGPTLLFLIKVVEFIISGLFAQLGCSRKTAARTAGEAWTGEIMWL